ncbi:lipopolysaccharide biosynthesis protein [Sphingomonas sp.]|uniref:lipopolysaccharide biosynthesis protein n=1 Tax=Sphingomonas sp. TaxID=28214 RepID=UPI0025D3B477|nr:lipopolysaccharide biosynthesis protein [Sphingomonas sp.]
MKNWVKDVHFRSLLKNSGYLAASRVVIAIAGLASLALAGRGLGVLLLGTLILITSYAKAASGISKFQSWQLIVRYGGQGMAEGDPDKFKTSTGFAFALDVVSGIGGMLLAVLILPFINQWVGVDDKYLWVTMLYCTLLPTMGAATPTGVLRALDRFDLISWQEASYQIVRAILSVVAFVADAPFEAWLAIWYITDLGGDLYFWFLAWRELKRHDLLDGITPTLRPTSLPGAWRFAINVNLTTTINTVWGPIGRLVVGGLLGPAGAALFRVASSLADSAQKPADMLAKAFYPEIVRMDLTSKHPWRLMLRGTAVASVLALVAVLILLVGGKPLLNLVFGKEFIGAYAPLMVLIVVPLLGVLSFPLAPMLFALGRSDGPLKARLVGSATFLLIIAPLSWRFGVIGAALAYVIGNVVQVGLMMIHVWAEYRRVKAGTVAG